MIRHLPIPQIPPSDLFIHIGRSLCAAQVLDHMLAYYLGIWAEVPPEEARKLVEDSLTKTLGALHKELRKRKLVPEGLEDRLSACREERNGLVHRIYAESWEDQYSPSKAPKLAQRITDVGEEANRLTQLFEQNIYHRTANSERRKAAASLRALQGRFASGSSGPSALRRSRPGVRVASTTKLPLSERKVGSY